MDAWGLLDPPAGLSCRAVKASGLVERALVERRMGEGPTFVQELPGKDGWLRDAVLG